MHADLLGSHLPHIGKVQALLCNFGHTCCRGAESSAYAAGWRATMVSGASPRARSATSG